MTCNIPVILRRGDPRVEDGVELVKFEWSAHVPSPLTMTDADIAALMARIENVMRLAIIDLRSPL